MVAPTRITDNYYAQTVSDNFDVIKSSAGVVSDDQIESGTTGASRANLVIRHLVCPGKPDQHH